MVETSHAALSFWFYTIIVDGLVRFGLLDNNLRIPESYTELRPRENQNRRYKSVIY